DISTEEAERIKKIKGVKSVSPNYEVEATLMDSVPLIGADKVWQLDTDGNNCVVSGKECLTGKGIKIGIIDTGVDYTHADLGGCFGNNCKVAWGYDFVNKDSDPMDDHGHGTHVAATAGGKGVLQGVAPDATIYAYKVLSAGGSGSFSNVIAAIERSVDPDQDKDFSDHLDVISLSLGAYCGKYPPECGPDDSVSRAIDNAVSAGVVAVIAAGNSGPGEKTIGSPGTAREAITVGAINKQKIVASFSSRGPVEWIDVQGNFQSIMKPDVVAPGVFICAAQWGKAWDESKCSTLVDEEHVQISGTSMAAPHVAGAVALLKQKHPDWSSKDIKSLIKFSADNLNYT
ncbi:MAG: S8 family serine peptidase, partial [Nanoarchaeota archaeon]